jgi:hypothetical protein
MSARITQRNEAVNSEVNPPLSPEEEAKREDEQFLAKNGSDIEELVRLITDRVDQDEVDRRLVEAQGWVDEEKTGTVFHQHSKGNVKIPLRHHTSNLFKLSEALELRIKAKRHGRDLNEALDNYLKKRIEVLQRMVGRESMS